MSTDVQHVLIVEDDHELRRLFEHTLIFEGYRVVSAAHGGEALVALNRETPSAVVLDLVLPWVNGLEILATMRETARLRAVPVLVVTGTPTSQFDLRDYAPLTVLHKPVNVEALAPMIQQLVARSAGC
jgi:DNA-binding response OmpR family regulator